MNTKDTRPEFFSACSEIRSAGLSGDRLRLLDGHKNKISLEIAHSVYGITGGDELHFLLETMDIEAELKELDRLPLELAILLSDFVRLWNRLR